MGRSAEGWRLRLDKRTGIYSVRFRHDGQRFDVSTGERDIARARRAAARIYSEALTRPRVGPVPAPDLAALPLRVLLVKWLASRETSVSAGKVRNDRFFVLNILEPRFQELSRITSASMAIFFRERLRSALRETLRQDRRVLRSFLAWCAEQGALSSAPDVPPLPKGAKGVRTGTPKTAPVPLSVDEAVRFLTLIPERSPSGIVLRARFVLQWETSLRQATIVRLSVPRHYRRGAESLTITADIDKAEFARVLPLTDAARAALDSVCPENGTIFGSASPYTLSTTIRRAARASGLDEAKVKHLSAYDLRHGRITDLLDDGASLRAVAYLAGHKKITTTNAYVAVREAHDHAAMALVRSGGVSGGESTTTADTASESDTAATPVGGARRTRNVRT